MSCRRSRNALTWMALNGGTIEVGWIPLDITSQRVQSSDMEREQRFWRTLGFSILLVCALPQTGCVNFPWNYGTESKLWGGYKYDRTCTLKRDVFVMVVDDGLAGKKPSLFPLCRKTRLALVPEKDFHWPGKRGRHHTAPSSIEAYYSNPDVATRIQRSGSNACRIEVFGIATNRTSLRLTHIERNRGFNWFYGTHDVLTPFASILDGPFKGREVDIADVSDRFQQDDRGPFMYRPVPPLLDTAP
jgi:hypothetical protein